jgi:hypothetical protein
MKGAVAKRESRLWCVYTVFGSDPTYVWLGYFRYRGDAIIAARAMRKSKARHRRGHRYFYRRCSYRTAI